jgi:hypothetical protein
MISTSSSIDKANFAKAQAFSSTVQEELLSNLVSEWTFDTGAVNNKTEDTWGNNDGLLGDGITTTLFPTYKTSSSQECVFGGCYTFDKIDDYIQLADSQELRMINGGTIAVWIYPKSVGESYGRVIDKSTDTGLSNGYALYLQANIIVFGTYGSPTSSRSVISFNQWQFVTVTFNNSGRKNIYKWRGCYGEWRKRNSVTTKYCWGNFYW